MHHLMCHILHLQRRILIFQSSFQAKWSRRKFDIFFCAHSSRHSNFISSSIQFWIWCFYTLSNFSFWSWRNEGNKYLQTAACLRVCSIVGRGKFSLEILRYVGGKVLYNFIPNISFLIQKHISLCRKLEKDYRQMLKFITQAIK